MNLIQAIKEKFLDNFNMISGLLRSARGDPDAWEASIRRFEARERLLPASAGIILFTGSSSITFWSSLAQDMAPLPVLNRGFGGSRMADVVHYAERIVRPCHPRAVLLFAGTNDIADPRPATAWQVFEGYLAFVKAIHSFLPGTPIYYISITPTPLRWKYWSIIREANHLIQAHTETDPALHFIDVAGGFLGPNGLPDRRLFRPDRLHPNARGYVKWTTLIKPVLLADFPRSIVVTT
jgi:lysophospholipase L1-like esterase